jgi:hypothetical protein
MASDRGKTVRIDDTASENAKRLIDGMKRYGVDGSREQLVRALLWGVTAPQAAGIVSAFILDSRRAGHEPSREPAPGAESVPVGETPPAGAAKK